MLDNERKRKRRPKPSAHEWFVQQLLVAETRRRTGLRFGVDRAQEQEPRRRHAGRLAKVRNRALEPGFAKAPRTEPEDGKDAPGHPGDDDHDEGHPVRDDDVDADCRNSRDNEEVERRAGDALHLAMVDQKILAECTHDELEKNSANHAKREERKAIEHLPAREPQELENPRANCDRDANDREMPGEGINRIAHDSLQSGRGARATWMDAEPFVSTPAAERHDLADDAPAMRPVDERHAHDNSNNHARRRHGEPKRRTVGPSRLKKALGHAADGSVSALKADFNQISKTGRNAAEFREDESRKTEPDDILPPRDDLTQHKLGKCHRDDAPQAGQHRTKEERRKNDIDEEARDIAHCIHDAGVNPAAKSGDEDEAD